MNIQKLKKKIKNDELVRLDDQSKVMVSKVDKNKYMVSFEKLGFRDVFTFDSLKETAEYIVVINNK